MATNRTVINKVTTTTVTERIEIEKEDNSKELLANLNYMAMIKLAGRKL